MSQPSISPAPPIHWCHPHQTCGAYTGPHESIKEVPQLDPDWSAHVPQPMTALDYSSYSGRTSQIWTGVEQYHQGYKRLEHLCTEFPARISGSDILERAIDWCERSMKESGLENVHTEEVMVPNWVRGEARVEVQIFESADSDQIERRMKLDVLAVGLSVGTVPLSEAQEMATRAAKVNDSSKEASSALTTNPKPEHILNAPLLVVDSYEQLNALLAKDANVARGKIILFNGRYTTYSETVKYRGFGGAQAESVGAVGAIIRSITPISLYTPHTGTMHDSTIPAVCCTLEDAEALSKLAQRGKKLHCSLYSSAHLNPDRKSRNVIGEIIGRELPNELVIIGAHIDSWDVGQGAHDDGQGCMVAWDVAHTLLKLNLRPRRTIRVVLFTDEEVRTTGAAAYHLAHESELPNVQAVLETDLGAYTSNGFGWTGCVEAKVIVDELMKLLRPYQADTLNPNTGAGVDVRPMSNAGVPALLLWFDREWNARDYFAFHHTHADTFDKIQPAMMLQNTQVLTMMSYLLAEIPQRLPHSLPTNGKPYGRIPPAEFKAKEN